MVSEDIPCGFSYCKESQEKSRLLESLTGSQEECTLYYSHKVVAEEGKNLLTPPKRVARSTRPATDLDVTGSPLKADFDPDEVFDDSSYCGETMLPGRRGPLLRGLEAAQARTLLSKVNTASALGDTQAWVLCAGTDNLQTLFLGSEKKNQRVVGLSTVTWAGPLKIRDLGGELTELQARLPAPSSSSGRPARRVEYRAEYLLTSGLEAGAGGGGCWLRLESEWTGRSVGPLLDPPPLEASTVLRASLGPGDQRLGGAGALYAELETLRGLLAGLTGGRMVWNRREDSRLEEEVVQVLEAASKLRPGTTIITTSGHQTHSNTTPDTTADMEEPDAVVEVKPRQDVDFTDLLWSALCRGAGSYEELSEALNLLLLTMVQHDIRPFIYSGNRSGLAGIVEGLGRGEPLTELTGARPLLLTIEMGIEKLRRDYSHALLATGLASKELVAPYLTGSSLAESVEQLGRLHQAVELSAACQTFLPLPPASLKVLLHSALLTLRDPLQPSLFTFPLNTADVKGQLESAKPDVWQMRLASDTVRTVVQLQVEQPDELESLPAPPPRREEEGTTEPDYFIFTLHSSTLN